jgi:hypothetical protein
VTLATTLVTPPLLRWSFTARGAHQPALEPGMVLLPEVAGD